MSVAPTRNFPLWYPVPGPSWWLGLSTMSRRIFSLLLFNLLVVSLATTLRATIPGVALVASDPFRHVCQLYADDLVILTALQADLRVALDAVHAWGVRWRFSFGVDPTAHATLSWRAHVEFVCSRGDRLFHQASAWCLGEGLPLFFSSSIFITRVLSSPSFGLKFIGDDPPALQQFDLALRR